MKGGEGSRVVEQGSTGEQEGNLAEEKKRMSQNTLYTIR